MFSCSDDIDNNVAVASSTYQELISLFEGQTFNSAAQLPSDVASKEVFWSSSDESVATVSGEGTITGVAPGNAVITATVTDRYWFMGEWSKKFNVKVSRDYLTGQKQALMSLYNATNGASWTNNKNWGTDAPLTSWYGVKMVGEMVTGLILKGNNVKGTIPADFGSQYKKTAALAVTRALGDESLLAGLQELDLSDNEIEGEIPAAIGNLSTLQNLNLSGNSIQGEIPPTIGNLTALEDLNLSGNKIEGEIPPAIGNLSSLQNLNLSGNEINGGIPKEIGKLTNLEDLNLSDNNIDGDIPEEIGNLESLKNLNISDNDITGNLPETMVNLENLETLTISGNKMSGEIPATILESDMWSNLKEEVDLTQQEGSELTAGNVEGVTLDKTSLDLLQGNTYTLKATIIPSTAGNKKVTWTTSNAAVATVSDAGVVTAVGSGSATITVTTAEGGFKATCTVNVTAASNANVENFGDNNREW